MVLFDKVILCSVLINILQVFAYKCGPLFLTVSATDKKLVLNWDYKCANPPTTVSLYDQESNATLQIIDTPYSPGTFKTRYSFHYKEFLPGNWNKNAYYPEIGHHCFHYYIVSYRDETVIDTACLKIEPTWMENFGSLPLNSLLIPGTHDSGAFVTGHLTQFIKRLVLTQKTDFWYQLVTGIRYFDIRVGHSGDTFYIYHGIAKCAKLVPELESVREFLQKSPKEVVILDFHSFDHPKPFNDELHIKLQDILLQLFGDLIYPIPKYVTRLDVRLEQLWRQNRRIIINYNDREQVAFVPWLWNGLRRDWGNLQKPEQLFQFIRQKGHRRPDGDLHILMAELTLKEDDPLSFFSSLKKLADKVNPMLNVLLRENNLSYNFNVIATDFHMGNDVVNIALETNKGKLYRY